VKADILPASSQDVCLNGGTSNPLPAETSCVPVVRSIALFDFIDFNSVTDLIKQHSGESWIPKAVHFIGACDLTPGINFMVLLEGSDGVLNNLGVTLVVSPETDTPKIIKSSGVSLRLSVEWNKIKIVNGIFLHFSSVSRRTSFLLQLVSTLTHVAELGDFSLST